MRCVSVIRLTKPHSDAQYCSGIPLGAFLVAKFGGADGHDITILKEVLRNPFGVYENAVFAAPVK